MLVKRTITNAEVQALMAVIDEIAKTKAKLPIRVIMTLTKNRNACVQAMKVADDARRMLVEKHGEEKKEGEGVSVTEENMAAFQKEYMELMSEEVEVGFHQINIDVLEKKLPAMETVENIYMFFEYIVKDDEKPAKASKSSKMKKA